MAIMKQHRKRRRERNTPFTYKCISRSRKDGKIVPLTRTKGATYKHGFLMNKVDSLYYGLISRNPQFEQIKNTRSAHIILHTFLKTHSIPKEKYYIIQNEIINKKDFKAHVNQVDHFCANCRIPISVKIKNSYTKKDILCAKCSGIKVSKIVAVSSITVLLNIVAKILQKGMNILHKYHSDNLFANK